MTATATSAPTLVDHGGQPAGARNMFVDPPKEIGAPKSGWSTLAAGVAAMTPQQRRMSFVKWGSGGFLAGTALILAFPPGPWSVPVLLGLLALLIPLIKNRFVHTVTWVCKDGIARYVCRGITDRLIRKEVLRFDAATELRTSATRHYRNGIYTHTSYTNTWSDAGGKTLLALTGSYRAKTGLPASTDFYMFAAAAEAAWSESLLARIDQEFRVKGSVDFHLTGADFVRLGNGWIELSVKGKGDRRESKDIAKVHLEKGRFTVEMVDARKGFFSSSGVFGFDYGALSNARVFLLALPRLTGLQLS